MQVNVTTLPEVTARVYDEVADGLLALFLLQQRVVAAEQLHRESVVGHVEHGAQLIAQVHARHVAVPRYGHLLSSAVARLGPSRPVFGVDDVRTLDGRANSRLLVEAAPASYRPH